MAVVDQAHKLTDKQLSELEKKIKKEYKKAANEVQKRIDECFSEFAKADKKKAELLKKGKITQEQYKNWRLKEIREAKRFEELRDRLAERMTKAHEVAIAYVNDATPSIYSLNRNYINYEIEKIEVKELFTLWDESTVRRLIVEHPDLMPYYPAKKALKRGIDIAFGKKKITEIVTSGILQGNSIPRIANDLRKDLRRMSMSSAIRTARTAATAAQNGGRQDAYEEAERMGIKIKRRWIATKDNRTRHEHGAADGQTVEGADTPFIVGGEEMMFPGDQSLGASGWNIYNCRCSVRTVEKEGIEKETRKMRVRDENGKYVLVNDMTYKQWENWVKRRGNNNKN